MKKIISFIFLVCLAFSVAANDNKLRVVYQNFNFYIPDSPSLVGYLGTNSNILIAKYSENPGERIIGLSVDKEVSTGGCSPIVFFKVVLNKNNSVCESSSVNSFRHVFLRDRDSGVWSGGSYKFFYFISDNLSTIFLVADDSSGEILKIESNFMKKEEIKEIFSKYL